MECDEDSDESQLSQISFRESSTSPFEQEMDEDADDCRSNSNIDVTVENMKDNCFILFKFEKKASVVYYVGKVISHYSPTELKVSYLRKKPGSSWSFIFPAVEDIHTLHTSDVAMILPDPQPRGKVTARMARLFTFAIDLSKFNVK